MTSSVASTSSATSPLAALLDTGDTWSTTSKLWHPCCFSVLRRAAHAEGRFHYAHCNQAQLVPSSSACSTIDGRLLRRLNTAINLETR